MVTENNLDSPRTDVAAATEQSAEGTSDEKKKLLDDKINGTNGRDKPEISVAGAFEMVDVDEEIHLLD